NFTHQRLLKSISSCIGMCMNRKGILMSNSNNDFFAIGAELIKKIEAHQFEAYFVGGCVRDFLLQKQITDIDIATSATPDELQEIFPHLIPIGIDHGTVLVREQSMSFEITTFRTDQQL